MINLTEVNKQKLKRVETSFQIYEVNKDFTDKRIKFNLRKQHDS